MRENEPVLLVLSVYDGEIILENGEILCEKRHVLTVFIGPNRSVPHCRLEPSQTLAEASRSS